MDRRASGIKIAAENRPHTVSGGWVAASTFCVLSLALIMTSAGCTVATSSTGQNPPVAAAPQFSESAGSYSSPINVTISCKTDGATICYTTDGTDPGEYTGNLYSGPIFIPCSCTLKAMAWKNQMTDSPVSAAVYSFSITPYCAGYYINVSQTVPCYWAGTKRVDLPGASPNSAARSIYVSQGTVYTAGWYEDGSQYVPCFWKGTVKTDLSGEGSDSGAGGICVVGGSVYVSGNYNNGTQDVPCLWKDGVRTDLPVPGGGAGDGWGLCVSGGTVYLAGNYMNASQHCVPCYWAGTTEVDLPLLAPSSDSSGTAIVVDNDTVYISGYYNNGTQDVPCYWVSTGSSSLRTDLPLPSGSGPGYAMWMYETGGTVLTAGHYNDLVEKACYWTGSVRTDLPGWTDLNVSGYAFAGQMSGGAVWMAGCVSNTSVLVPCLWTGSQRIDLPGDGMNNAEVYAFTMY